MKINLNNIGIQTDGRVEGQPETEPQTDHSYGDDTMSVGVYFKDLESALVTHLRAWPYVVGCVAWLTNIKLLSVLAERKGASFVVQKEDFLRPDAGTRGPGLDRSQLRRAYDAIKPLYRLQFDGLLSHMSVACEPTCGIRCAGLGGKARLAKPRMHHKFAVFCDGDLQPRAVWTGSFNWSHNALDSIENAVYIAQPQIARAYFDEFQQVAAISEPLDWTSEYVEPEWRIGT